MRKSLVLLAAMALLLGALSPASAGRGHETETSDVLGQMLNPDTGEADADDGVRALYAADAASLRRTANGIQARTPSRSSATSWRTRGRRTCT